MEKLTPSQSKVLKYIYNNVERFGSAPTLRELCGFMGFSAVGSAQDVIAALRKKGFLTSPRQQKARSFRLTDKARMLFEKVSDIEVGSDQFFAIPCLGSVPAGNPLEAIEDRIDTIQLSVTLLPRPRPKAEQLFAVRTSGLSMMGAGILDGDWLVVKSQQEADPGSIVIARVAGEVTCKRLLHDLKKGWFLKPENPDFSNIYAGDSGFEIVGRVLALQRSFAS